MALDLTPSSNSSTSITARRGDYHEIPLTIYSANGAVRNITDDKIWFTVKSNPDAQADSAAEIRKGSSATGLTGISKVSSTAGTALVVLDSTDTDPLAIRSYWYDVKIQSTSDSKSYAVLAGPFILQRQTTRQPSGG